MKKMIKNIIEQLKERLPEVKQVLKRPLVILYMYLSINRLRLLIAASILSLMFIFPPAIDAGMKRLFPNHNSKKIFGLIGKKKIKNYSTYYYLAYTFCYIGVVGSNLVVVWLMLPQGIAAASKTSQRLKSEAESLKSSGPKRAYWLSLFAYLLDVKNISEAQDVKSTIAVGQKNENRSAEILAQDDSGRYRITKTLGKGAMGVVHHAVDQKLEREVALKELPSAMLSDSLLVNRFKTEATALAKLSHPNIVQVFDLIEFDGRMFMVLEYIDGGDLSQLIAKQGSLDFKTASELIASVAGGLAAAHEKGIVHRDVKPANILLTQQGQPKITDFGIARLTCNSRLTQEGLALGSPSYMSPEQCSSGEIDHRSDIYSLGITLYEMLTGKLPFNGDITSILTKHLMEKPNPPSELVKQIPSELDNLILSMLEKEPAKRLQTASVVVSELSDISHPKKSAV